MTDSTASLVLAVDTTQAAKASVDLDKLTASGEKVEAQFNKNAAASANWQQNMAGVQTALKSTADRAVELSQSTQKLMDRYDPLGSKLRALQSDLAAFQKEMGNSTSNAAMRTFQGLEDDITKVSNLMSTAGVAGFEDVAKAADKGAFSTAQARRELIVLGHEAISGNFSRMPGSFMVLAERMGQSAMLFSPLTLGLLAFVAAGAGLGMMVAHAESIARELNTLEVQMQATGRGSAFTTAEFKALIDQMALMPGVSKASADSIVSIFTKTHEIGGPMLKDLSLLTADFAKAIGTDAVTAAKDLATAFADPEKGAETLDASLGTLSASTILQIKQMVEANDKLGAQKLLYDALKESVNGLSHSGLTPMQQATEGLHKAWDEAMHSLGNSSAIAGVNAALVGVIGSVKWLIDHRDGLLTALKVVPGFAAPIGAVQLMGKVTPAQTGGSTGSWTDHAQEDAKKLDDMTKSALLLGGGYSSAASNAAKLATQQKVLTDAINANIAAGKGDSEAVKKLKDELAGLQEYMAPKASTKGLDDRAAKLADALTLEKTALDREKELYDERMSMLSTYHSKLGLSDNDYYAGREVARQAYLDSLTASYQREAGIVADSITKNPAEAAAKQKQLDAMYQAYVKHYNDVDKLRAKDATEAVAAVKAELAATLDAVSKTGTAEIASLEKAIAAQKLHNDEIGKTPAQIALVKAALLEQQAAQSQADADYLSGVIDRMNADQEWVRANPEIMAIYELRRNELLKIAADQKQLNALQTDASIADAQAALDKKNLAEQVSMWGSINNAAQTTFDNIFQGGQNAFTKLANTLKTGLLDLLYQMTVKKWVFSIFASITGGASTIANAAGMAGSVGGGGGLGTVASGASLLGNSAFGMGLSGAWGAGGGLMSTLGAGTSLLGSGTLAGIGSGLGIIAGALGPIALALAVLPSLFGHTLKDSGIQGTFGGDKGFEGSSYKYYEGGLFSSDKTDIGALDETVRKTLGDTFNAMKTQVSDFATALGLSTDKLKGFTSDVKISLKGLSDADAQKKIQDALATANNDLAQQVIGTWVTTTQDVIRQVQNTAAAMEAGAGATSSVTSSETTSVYKPSEFAHEGEKAIDTLKRLATSLETANTWLTRFGASLFDASLAGGSQASDFIDKTGGQDAFNSQASSYFNNYYTSAQKYQAAQDEIAKKLKDAGVAMPQTASEFKAAMDQFLAMGVAGQDGAAALLSVNEAFAQIHGTIGQLEQAMGVSADSLKSILDDVRKGAATPAEASKRFEDSIYSGLGSAMTQGLSQMIMNAVVGPLVNGLLAGATGSAAALTAGGVAGGSSSAVGGAAAGGAVASGGAAAGAAMAQGGAMAGAAVASTIDQARTYMAGFAAIMADPTVRDTIGKIAAGFGDIAASMPGLSGGASSVSSAMSSAGSSAGGMSSAVSQLGDTIDTEVKRLRGLMVTDSTNSAVSSAVLMAQFAADTAKARAGDQTALAALAGLSQQIEAQAQLTATSSVDLARTRGWLAGSLEQTQAAAGTKSYAPESAANMTSPGYDIRDTPTYSSSYDATPVYSPWEEPTVNSRYADSWSTTPIAGTGNLRGQDPNASPDIRYTGGGIDAVQYDARDPNYRPDWRYSDSWSADPHLVNPRPTWYGPAYEQGTNYVPNDGLAYLHAGEAVVPAAYNKSNAGQDSAVLQELRALRSEVTSLRTQQASNHLDAQRLRLRPAKTLERWEQGGMPTTRQDGVVV